MFDNEKSQLSTAQYDILTNKWSTLPCILPDEYCFEIAIVPLRNFLYGFGGCTHQNTTPSPATERFLRLNTTRADRGW